MTTAGALFASSSKWPLASLAAITGGRALILAPHPDDESLGCGGLIGASCAAGAPPFVVMLTDGAGSHPNSATYPPARLRAVREAETIAAMACLGLDAERIAFLRQPDTRAPTEGPAYDAVVDCLSALAVRVQATSLLASWRHDPHCDHEAAASIATSVSARLGLPHWQYPVWGRTLPPDTPLPQHTGVRLDVSTQLAAKRRAIRSHRSQWAGLITDDPDGFQMREDFMAHFEGPTELYLEAA